MRLETEQLRPKFQNLNISDFDLSNTLYKKQLSELGFIGRFWSKPDPLIEITLESLAANVLCQPSSFREIFALAGMVGIPTMKAFADMLYNDKEMDGFCYEYFNENISILEEYQQRAQAHNNPKIDIATQSAS